MPYKDLNIDFQQPELNAAIVKLEALQVLLPQLINLAKGEKGKKLKLGAKGDTFISKALQHAINRPDIVPKFVSLAAWQQDWVASQKMSRLGAALAAMLEGITDTAEAMRIEALDQSLNFYKSALIASKTNVVGADSIVDDLKALLPGSFKRKKKK